MHSQLTGTSVLSPSTLPHSQQPGFSRMFRSGEMTLGLFFPIETYSGAVPSMVGQVELAKQAEVMGFAALWLRDVPLHDPAFGDVGQVYDPFVYLGYLAAQTDEIAFATGAIVLPVRNPLHVAKQATTVDQLSNGRFLMGVASGDRAVEFPAFGVDPARRGEIFREHFDIIRQSQKTSFQSLKWSSGTLHGADMIPKAVAEEVPLLVTGSSQQTMGWTAKNAHGWVTYPRPPAIQSKLVSQWREAVSAATGDVFKPFTQSLYLDLAENPAEPPRPIHLGLRMGRDHLVPYLDALKLIGINHLMFNLRFGSRPVSSVLEELETYVLPHFPSHQPNPSNPTPGLSK